MLFHTASQLLGLYEIRHIWKYIIFDSDKMDRFDTKLYFIFLLVFNFFLSKPPKFIEI